MELSRRECQVVGFNQYVIEQEEGQLALLFFDRNSKRFFVLLDESFHHTLDIAKKY